MGEFGKVDARHFVEFWMRWTGWRETLKGPPRRYKSPDGKWVKLKNEVGFSTWSLWPLSAAMEDFEEEGWKRKIVLPCRDWPVLLLKSRVYVRSHGSRTATSRAKTTDLCSGSSLSSGSTAAAWGPRGGYVSGCQPVPEALSPSSSLTPSSSPPLVYLPVSPAHPA